MSINQQCSACDGTMCGCDCNTCPAKDNCPGCKATNGNPMGGGCLAAEYIKIGGCKQFEAFKQTLLAEINALGIPGMKPVEQLFSLSGAYVNLAYDLPGAKGIKFLLDNRVYLGAQTESVFNCGSDGDRCFGIVADTGFILVCTYGKDGIDPELVLYKQR